MPSPLALPPGFVEQKTQAQRAQQAAERTGGRGGNSVPWKRDDHVEPAARKREPSPMDAETYESHELEASEEETVTPLTGRSEGGTWQETRDAWQEEPDAQAHRQSSGRRGVRIQDGDACHFVQATADVLNKIEDMDGDMDGVSLEKKVFELLVGASVTANAVAIALEADVGCLECTGENWNLVDCLFCAMFLAEMAYRARKESKRLVAAGPYGGNYFSIGRAFDVFFVVTRFAGLLIGVSGLGPAVIKVLSLPRIWHVTLALKVVLEKNQGFHQLWLLMAGLHDTLRVVFYVVCLLSLCLLVFAIVMTVSYGKKDGEEFDYSESFGDHDEYWGSTSRSLYTLTQVMTFSEAMRPVVWVLVRRYPFLIILFVVFWTISVLMISNLLTSTVVESTMTYSRASGENAAKDLQLMFTSVLQSMQHIFIEADADGNGVLDMTEMETMMAMPRVTDRMKVLDIPLMDLMMMYRLFDVAHVEEVPVEMFFRGVSRLRGDATAFDMHHVAVDMIRHTSRADGLREKYEVCNDVLGNVLDNIDQLEREVIRGGKEDGRDPVLINRRRPREDGEKPSDGIRAMSPDWNPDADSDEEEDVRIKTKSSLVAHTLRVQVMEHEDPVRTASKVPKHLSTKGGKAKKKPSKDGNRRMSSVVDEEDLRGDSKVSKGSKRRGSTFQWGTTKGGDNFNG